MSNLPDKQSPKNFNAASFGYTIIGEFIFCFFVGYWADQRFGTGYIWTLTGVGFGMAMIGYELWKLIRKN